MKEELCTLYEKRKFGEVYLLYFRSSVCAESSPGQFVNVKVPGPGMDPLLRRPFSVAWASPAGQSLTLMLQVRGRGTASLAGLEKGAAVSLLGPLGTGFPLQKLSSVRSITLLGGGIGAAPLFFLSKQLTRLQPRTDIRFLWGLRSYDFAGRSEYFKQLFPQLSFATEDGSCGFHGTVLDLFEEQNQHPQAICACGPEGLLERLKEIAACRNIKCYVSVEARMACGYGICRGCAIPLASGDYGMVCCDGPVFEASRLATLTVRPGEFRR